jgi:ATP-dependent Lon protease
MDEVLTHALVRKPEPIVWEDTGTKPAEPPADDEPSALTAH